jgi:glucose/arabinose dehydrogenase
VGGILTAKRSPFLAILLALAVWPAAAGPFGRGQTLPPTVPVGFAVTPAGVSVTATSLAFSPDGKALYVASGQGPVMRYPVIAGVLLGKPTTFVSGLTQPLGVLAAGQNVFIASLAASGTTGIVHRARDTNGDGVADSVVTVISGLPNGRHNTNGMAIGPDGKLYITNGSSTDSGFGSEGGPPEVQPYTGSVLRVDPAATNLTPSPDMVVATGMRNIFDIAFFPPGHPAAPPGTAKVAVPMNGPDGQTYGSVTRPAGEDTLNIFDTADGVIEHFGFPWCLYDRTKGGLGGFTQAPSQGSCNPLPAKAFTGLVGPAAQAKPSALFGLHVSADGLAFNPGTNFPATYDHDLFVAEFGNFFGTIPAGHKIVRVHFNAAGGVASVDDFMTALLPLDLTFAPDGAMWVADYEGLIYRVASIIPR